MTKSQTEHVTNAYDKIGGSGGQFKVNGEAAGDSASLLMKISCMDTQSVSRLLADLATVQTMLDASAQGLQYDPQEKPHIRIKIDSDCWYEGSGVTWH
ncbi:hypothetical protein [Spirosoma spitsbergense]|uniref:hypothetical protein n=1 Tax=Spirosoma spitsbergense TaxID=431554 RepID=UPI00037EF0CF|nr:hypothetical protein [Spirosoma spitsbergense]